MSSEDITSRRTALKMVGSSLTMVAGGSATVLAGEKQLRGVRQAGIEAEYYKLLDSGEFSRARDLLKNNSVKYSSTTYYRNDPADSPSVSPADYYSKDSSWATFDTVLFDSSIEEYALTLEWHLRDVQQDVDLPAPKDKAAIAYRPDSFIYQDNSLKHGGSLELTNASDKWVGVTEDVKEPPFETGGAVVSFDDRLHDAQGLDTVGDGYMQIRIKRDGGTGTGPVAGTFSHAWSPAGASAGGQDINLTLGSISISTDTLVDNWTLPGDSERGQNL